MDDALPVVAILDTSPDIVDVLRVPLEQAGIVVVSALTHEIREGMDLERFMREHQPRVIIYDIAPPYDANWKFFQHICRMPAVRDTQFVLTSANTQHVRELAGTNTRVYEIVGRPFDLGQIVQAVREALRARPTR